MSDETVAPLYGARLAASFDKAGIKATTVTVPAGESSKEFAAFGRLMNALLDQRPDRKTTLVALGGGVVGDLAGFAAAMLLRGVDFIQVPTTLLAQVDSSVGGKTGINTRHGKNLVGAFYQPRLVLADTDVLDTLPRRELLAGYAEVAKYGLIDDPDFFDWCEANGAAVLAGDAAKRDLRHRAELPAPRRASWRPTSARPPTCARCSISATPSAMRWRRRPASAATCCTARRSAPAWRWPSTCRRGSASARRPTPSACAGISARVGLPMRLRAIGGDNRRTGTPRG